MAKFGKVGIIGLLRNHSETIVSIVSTLLARVTFSDHYNYYNLYIYIYNLHYGECASVFNALFKTRRVSAFAFLRGLNMQLLQSRKCIYIYIDTCLYAKFFSVYIA